VQVIFSPSADDSAGHGENSEGKEEGTPPKAIGVEFEQDGVIHHAYLNRHYFEDRENVLDAYGVILAAGAIHTPKLLLNSGIGPAEEVAGLPTPLVQASPGVGKNLQDHPTVNVKFQVNSYGTAGE
jgi:choline dehydrogenase-like flavoprotein